jgi:hypothetical protein
MTKVAIVVLADTKGHENLGRITNALQAAKEFHEAGDDLELIFDDAGTEWTEELEDESHDLHEIYKELFGQASACSFCSSAFEVESEIEKADENDGHPSFKELVDDGYEVITF